MRQLAQLWSQTCQQKILDLVDEDDKKEAEKTNEHIDTLMKRMREISYDLIPNTLLRKGLIAALKQFADFVNEGDGLKINFAASEHIAPEQQKSIHIYRIIQEVINNTIKHSGAKLLSIDLKQKLNYTMHLYK